MGVNRASRWLIASAAVVFVCGVLAVVLPLTFSVGIAALLGSLFFFAAIAYLIFGIHFGSGTLGWHALIAGLYAVAAINLLVNPLLGMVLLALVVGVVLVVEGIIEIVLLFRAPPVSTSRLDFNRWSSHSCARDYGMRALATC